ncbi:Uncharacterised protein [Staphylococcus aureus]|nr:Uncharacterised protein [Staphylococcus aureus]
MPQPFSAEINTTSSASKPYFLAVRFNHSLTRRLLICFGNKSNLFAAKMIFLFPTIRLTALINDPSKSNTSTTLTTIPFLSASPDNNFKKSSLSNPTS